MKLIHHSDGSVSILIRTANSKEWPLPDLVHDEYIREVFLIYDSNMSATANALGMHRRTLQRILKSHPHTRRVRVDSRKSSYASKGYTSEEYTSEGEAK